MTNSAADTVQALAHNALPAFFLALLALLAGVAALWWLLQRYGVHRPDSRYPRQAYLVGHLLVACVLMASGATVFAVIADNIGDGRTFGQLDMLFSDTIRSTVSTTTLQVFALLTDLGDPIALTILTVIVGAGLLWRRRYGWCAVWLFAVAGNGLLTRVLKSIFERPRPVYEHGLAFTNTYSFPSGHTSSSVAVFGMLAYLALRLLPPQRRALHLPILLAAAALAFTVGCSRVFLHVHFASDVLAGFATAIAWLALSIGAAQLVLYRQGHNA